MADEQNRGGKRQGTGNPAEPEQSQNKGQAGTAKSSQAERDRQNRDDPSRAPESGDRK
jgi:hypothetical protein